MRYGAHSPRVAVFSFILFFVPLAAHPAYRYVSVSTGSDANPGTSGQPFKTITKGLAAANAGDTVTVFEGTYNAAGGEVFPLAMKSGVRLTSDRGPALTIIDAARANRVFICNGNAGGTVIEGFTIRNGLYGTTSSGVGGGGIYIHSGDQTTIRNNVIEMNELGATSGVPGTSGTPGCGGGVFLSASAPSIYSNVIRGNVVRGGNGGSGFGATVPGPGGAGGYARGGGLCAVASIGGSVVNNTFYANEVHPGNGGPGTLTGPGGSGTGGGMYADGITTANNIFALNVVTGGSGMPTGVPSGGGLASSGSPKNNLFFNNVPDAGSIGSASVTGDPLFASPPGSFDLLYGSPAIARGLTSVAPQFDLDGWTRPNPPSIGAYEPTELRTRVAGDLNKDGFDDIVIRFAGTGTLGSYYLGPGPTATFMVYGDPGEYVVAGVGDLRNDATSTILLLDGGGALGMWYVTGSSVTGAGFVGGTSHAAIPAVADFDGDGKDDILFRDFSGNIGVWLMNGTVIAGGGLIGTAADYSVVAVADFNGDGKADILLQDALGNVGMWLMNGQTIVSGGLVGSPGAYSVAAAADFDGDGFADILLRDSLGALGLWRMNGTAILGGGFIGSPGSSRVPLVGDFNNDGRADILLQDPAGAIGVWLMNGSTIIGGSMLAAGSPRFEIY